MNAVIELGVDVPLAPLCEALGVSRATIHRRSKPKRAPTPRPTPERALDDGEKQAVLATLCSARFVDRSPAEVVYTLLDDEAEYLCSERTMYRVLAENDTVKERRAQRTHPPYARPELVATAPNQVWSWDITRLRTTAKWSYFYLYVILDIFSRYAVGWMVARQENAALAKLFLEETIAKYEVVPGLIVHSDRGTQMTSKTVAQMFADHDVTRSLSRPQVSNDNPFSESAFKTAKYHPSFPGRFAAVDEVKSWGREYFGWYNDDHKHSGIAFLTPADVFFGRTDAVLSRRHGVLLNAFEKHPERFPNGPPKRALLMPAVYINPPLPPPGEAPTPVATEVRPQ